MKSGSSVQDYISRLTNIQQELVGTPEEISDESLVSHLLANLSKKFKSMVDIITIRPAENKTLDSITTQLIEYETSNDLCKDQEGIADDNFSEGQAIVGAEHNSNQGKCDTGVVSQPECGENQR